MPGMNGTHLSCGAVALTVGDFFELAAIKKDARHLVVAPVMILPTFRDHESLSIH
jgi:hypothetical protein